MQTKDFSTQVKAIGEGTASVVFATLLTWDKDQDWTEPGAFGNQTAKIAPAHDWRAPGMGIARIHEEANQAVADLQFNLAQPSAREWFQAIKFEYENGVPQQYSYGFDILGDEMGERAGRRGRILKKLRVQEGSPVMVGAGVGTRTLTVKHCASCGGPESSGPKSGDGTLTGEFEDVIHRNRRLLSRMKSLHAEARRDNRVMSDLHREHVAALATYWKELHQSLTAEDIDPDRLLAEFMTSCARHTR